MDLPCARGSGEPLLIACCVAGDACGSYHIPLIVVAINTAVVGAYCLPPVACMAFYVTKEGVLLEGVDLFGNVTWDDTRLEAQRNADEIRR